jgi:hypothetical protein
VVAPDRPDRTTDEEVVRLLTSAGASWTTARGVCRHWRRPDLVMVGFDRHFALLEAGGRQVWGPEPATGSRPPTGEELEATLSLAADRMRSRFRAELVSAHGPEVVPDLLVVDNAWFWARTGAELTTNDGDPGHRHGGDAALQLLRPSNLPALFDLTATRTTVVAGRGCVGVRAVPRPGAPDGADPFGMVVGGDEFLLDVDLATGLLMRVTKLVDGTPAEVHEWLELELDVPLADSLFAPLTSTA